MRRHPLLLCALLCALPVGADDDPLTLSRGVHLLGDHETGFTQPFLPRLPEPEPVDIASGRLLLHRLGCTGCHDLDLPSYPHPRGPGLDRLGRKTHAAWLDLWLRDPTAYLPQSRMPRVQLGDAARARIVSWLADLGRLDPMEPSPVGDQAAGDEPPVGDAYRGGRLFEGLQCRGCHAAGGTGGRTGPALDRLGWKVGVDWLQAALGSPATEGLSPGSHPYVLSVRDIADLSAFLVRRFDPPGGPDQSVMVDTSDMAEGMQAALVHGCFECHGMEAIQGPRLRWPVSRERAISWLAAHDRPRGGMPALPLSAPQKQAMVAALADVGAPMVSRQDTQAFWDLPIAAQGDPSPLFEAGRRLEPSACGQCHVRHLQEWSRSQHAAAFSPGLRAQLVGASPEFVEECLSCHTPLREQIVRALSLGDDDTALGPAGVDCAGCHVRSHRYYGPGRPASQDRLVAAAIDGSHHGGVEAPPELFEDAAFCTACHQFEADGLALEGKLLQNTYSEWLGSAAAAEGLTCQSCHMPRGDHRMRGLHDRDFVRDAIEFEVDWRDAGDDSGHLGIWLRNVGAGHALPTYTTGALYVKIFLSDAHGGVIESSLRTRAVQRRLSVDGQTELFDTRIPVDGVWRYEETLPITDEARFVNVLVEVDPDHFYRRFFALLEPSAARARSLLEQARGGISDSPYILFARQIRVTDQD
ncbi:MAG TPA: multiheme c-type cytochrome [Candidatus Latescibacteria bacterium]|nr:multiheme c-type cytochrome [Candidatus Latescibacterota bacterium]HJP32221.1 multiheme c-type cytochrome [Candidatus Latescibacterota bacterium]